MHRLVIVILGVLLAACEAVQVKDAASIKIHTPLNAAITKPVGLPVTYYIDKKKPESGVNFHGILEESLELVLPEILGEQAIPLSKEARFEYLLKYSTNSTLNTFSGGWNVTLTLEVLNHDGDVLFQSSSKRRSSGSGYYDFKAVFNSLAFNTKETLYQFLNSLNPEGVAEAKLNFANNDPVRDYNLKKVLKEIQPSGSGSGFFINGEGQILTAAHVVDECLLIEVQHQGESFEADIGISSKLLDLAVIDTQIVNQELLAFNEKSVSPQLGKQVFVTGFPLSGILSDYPSLTVGNVSSLGGLKGSKGTFQFSAPVQPGNSGGPVVDYQGNLVGVVSSTLNQAMLIKKTGALSQNVNFGIRSGIVQQFLDNNEVNYATSKTQLSFEQASAEAVNYSKQIVCYQ